MANEGIQILIQALQQAAASMSRSGEAYRAAIAQRQDYELRKQQLEEQNKMRKEYHDLMADQIDLRAKELDLKKEVAEQRRLFGQIKMYGDVNKMVAAQSTMVEKNVLREFSSQEKWKGLGSFETLADITKRRAQVESKRDMVAARQGDKITPQDVLVLSFMRAQKMPIPEFEQRVRQDPALYDDYLTRLSDFENEAKPAVTMKVHARRDAIYEQVREMGLSLDFSYEGEDSFVPPEGDRPLLQQAVQDVTKSQETVNIDPDNEISLLKAAVAKPGGEEYRDLLQRIQTGLENGQSMGNIGVALTEMRKKLAAEDSSEGAQVLWDAFVSRLSDDLQAMSAESPE